jgi:hypothetical protein
VIPFILSIFGGYLIGSSCCDKKYKDGGKVDVPKTEIEYEWLKEKPKTWVKQPFYKIKK